MNENKEISVDSIFQEGVLHAKIAQLSQIIVSLYQEINRLKKETGEA